MKKKDILEMLESVGDDEELFVVSKDYIIDDDSTWVSENNSDFIGLKKDGSDCYLVMDCKYFN